MSLPMRGSPRAREAACMGKVRGEDWRKTSGQGAAHACDVGVTVPRQGPTPAPVTAPTAAVAEAFPLGR